MAGRFLWCHHLSSVLRASIEKGNVCIVDYSGAYHVGDVIAFKQFRVEYEKRPFSADPYPEMRLVPAYREMSYEYADGVNVASCPRSRPDMDSGSALCDRVVDTVERWMWQKRHTDRPTSPEESCRCGFYAMKSRQDWSEADVFSSKDVYVDAVVRLSGKVIAGEKGYRAEKLEIIAFAPRFSRQRDQQVAEALHRRLFSGAKYYRAAGAMCEDFMVSDAVDDREGYEAVGNRIYGHMEKDIRGFSYLLPMSLLLVISLIIVGHSSPLLILITLALLFLMESVVGRLVKTEKFRDHSSSVGFLLRLGGIVGGAAFIVHIAPFLMMGAPLYPLVLLNLMLLCSIFLGMLNSYRRL